MNNPVYTFIDGNNELDKDDIIVIFNKIINELNELEVTVGQQDAQLKLLQDKFERAKKYE